MTLIRWKPVHDVTAWHPVADVAGEFVNMQHEIDRMFDRFRGGILDDGSTSTWLPAVDIVENPEGFVVKVEVPGINKNDVKITVQNGVLTLRGERKAEEETKGESYRRVERSRGTFQRSFTLPTSVKSEKIDASYIDGILTITLPKAEEAKPKEIEVKVQ
jgi:HSP20 family protein